MHQVEVEKSEALRCRPQLCLELKERGRTPILEGRPRAALVSTHMHGGAFAMGVPSAVATGSDGHLRACEGGGGCVGVGNAVCGGVGRAGCGSVGNAVCSGVGSAGCGGVGSAVCSGVRRSGRWAAGIEPERS